MIKDLKEFQAFLKICRKQGVSDIRFQGITVSFGDMPKKGEGIDLDDTDPASDGLTDEQLMYFSAGGEP